MEVTYPRQRTHPAQPAQHSFTETTYEHDDKGRGKAAVSKPPPLDDDEMWEVVSEMPRVLLLGRLKEVREHVEEMLGRKVDHSQLMLTRVCFATS